MLGFFNEILSWDEKWGDHDRSEHQIEAFRNMVKDFGLTDLGFSVLPFTWCSNHEGCHKILK